MVNLSGLIDVKVTDPPILTKITKIFLIEKSTTWYLIYICSLIKVDN